MKVGVWFYGLGTVLTGILDIVWGAFDASHQPFQSLGKNVAGQHVLAYVAGVWLVAAGLAILWRRSTRIGAAASAIVYLIFAAFWLARYYVGVHALGWRVDVMAGVSFGLAQQLMLVAPAAIVYACASSPDSLLHKRAPIAARWMLGLSPILFGLTGIAFLLAGVAICSGIMDVLAARLLALMLLLFEGLVEIPPIFIRLHNQATWGAAVYNVVAIGACWVFAEYLAGRVDRKQIGLAENLTLPRSDSVVA